MMREADVVKAVVGVHVLVADDNPAARELLEAVLVYGGAFVTLVASAREALAAMSAKPVDVVVAAVAMPGEDGYWLVQEIRARAGEARAVPMVALVVGREDGPDRTLSAGFQAHLRKPVDPWELCRMVASLARKA